MPLLERSRRPSWNSKPLLNLKKKAKVDVSGPDLHKGTVGSAPPPEKKAIRQLAESAKEGRAATDTPSEKKG